MNNLPRPHLSPRSMLPTLRYHGQNPLQPLALPLPRAMPSLHPTVPTQPTTPRMPTPAAQAIPTTPSRNTTIRRHNISRKCIHCKVPHIGGPLHCKVNKMRMRPFTTTTASTQTGNYTCSTCVLPPTSPNTTLPAPFDFTDTPDPASPLPAPSNYTYSYVGPLSPYLTQTSPPSMATSPPPTPTSATSQATKPSVSNVGPLVLRYQAALQKKKDNPSFTQAKSLEGVCSLTAFKESRYIAELFIVDNDKFLSLQFQQRALKVLKSFNKLCKEAMQQEAMKPALRQAKQESQMF